jgi:protein gp37
VARCDGHQSEEADRDIPKLLAVPARVRFLSIEPMLGPIDLRSLRIGFGPSALHDALRVPDRHDHVDPLQIGLDWVIAGGESGPKARPAHPDWFRSLRDQCADTGVAFHFKQWGEWASVSEVEGEGKHFSFPDGATVRRVGTKAAGRILGGVTHDAFPMT